jgi:hypothetical protein
MVLIQFYLSGMDGWVLYQDLVAFKNSKMKFPYTDEKRFALLV